MKRSCVNPVAPIDLSWASRSRPLAWPRRTRQRRPDGTGTGRPRCAGRSGVAAAVDVAASVAPASNRGGSCRLRPRVQGRHPERSAQDTAIPTSASWSATAR